MTTSPVWSSLLSPLNSRNARARAPDLPAAKWAARLALVVPAQACRARRMFLPAERIHLSACLSPLSHAARHLAGENIGRRAPQRRQMNNNERQYAQWRAAEGKVRAANLVGQAARPNYKQLSKVKSLQRWTLIMLFLLLHFCSQASRQTSTAKLGLRSIRLHLLSLSIGVIYFANLAQLAKSD